MTTRYVFGDIHGHYDTLIALLSKIGLDPDKLPANIELIFLGDLIDRGPKSAEVVTLVKRLCEEGKARCILANHEFNFVNFNTQISKDSGVYRRPRNDKNLSEIAETWASYRCEGKHQSDLLAEHVNWFRTLPVALELDGLNVIHACWHEPSLAKLEKRGGGYYLNEEHWNRAWQKGDEIFEAVEILCKGLEKTLPDDMQFKDKGDTIRTEARVCWWIEHPSTWAEYMLAPGADLSHLSGTPPSNTEYKVSTPTLFGHYWREGQPKIETPMASCIDYSVAAFKPGYLCAYEFRENDTELHTAQMHFVKQV